jgi:Zn-dependent protease with chaperone function
MDFFEHQKRARRNTAVLVVLYALAVVAIIGAVDLVLTVFWATEIRSRRDAPIPAGVHWFAIGFTLLIILGTTARKVLQLADGGEAVAEMVGARRVDPGTTDPKERRLVNVVEEMAIASGTAVPGIYVQDDEMAINAFAAGYQPNAAIVAVTRGTLEHLNRDELQAVIGHEFSHILNGDMRINVRMLGVLFGITALGSIGQFLMRGSGRSGGRRDGNSGIAALGLGLWIVGSVGVFFARIIKAAVSRQREFLADASSVQFTRNPDGIAGALDRIAATGAGTTVNGRYAEELSHMFFGQSVRMFFSGLMDTHPPIEQRIERVRPGFQRRSYRLQRADDDDATPAATQAAVESTLAAEDRDRDRRLSAWGGAAAVSLAAEHRSGSDTARPPGTTAAAVVATVGNPSPAHVRYAQGLLGSIPPMLRMLVGEARGAQAVALALVLARDEATRAQQVRLLDEAGAGSLAAFAAGPALMVRNLGAEHVLPLFDLATPALKRLPATERQTFLHLLRIAIEADRRVTLQEFTLLTIATKRLADHADRVEPTGNVRLGALRDDVVLLVSLLAHAGTRDASWATIAFERALLSLRLGVATQALARTDVKLASVTAALLRLRRLAPADKSRLLEACVLAATADEKLEVAEAELVRMIASELECPLPPIIAGSAQGDAAP